MRVLFHEGDVRFTPVKTCDEYQCGGCSCSVSVMPPCSCCESHWDELMEQVHNGKWIVIDEN